jgi:hypothetical protein
MATDYHSAPSRSNNNATSDATTRTRAESGKLIYKPRELDHGPFIRTNHYARAYTIHRLVSCNGRGPEEPSALETSDSFTRPNLKSELYIPLAKYLW